MKKISPKNHKSSCHPEFISGSYQLLNNTLNWSGSEQILQTSKELFEEGKVLNKNNLNFCFMFHPFFGKNSVQND